MKKINWPRVFAELKKEGWTLSKIADCIDIPKTTLHDVKSGAKTSDENCIKLILFYDSTVLKTSHMKSMLDAMPFLPEVRPQ